MFRLYRRGKMSFHYFLLLVLIGLLSFYTIWVFLIGKVLIFRWKRPSDCYYSEVKKLDFINKRDFSTGFQGPHILPVKLNDSISNQAIYNSEKMTIFSPSELYSRTRIPALIFAEGHFLAFCEGRVHGIKDYGEMDILMRRGVRKGLEIEWEEEVQVVVHIPKKRTMNPSPVFDRKRNAIILIFIAVLPNLSENDMMKRGKHLVSVMMIRSYDFGLTWMQPIDISNQTVNLMQPVPASYFTGPGHSIQTRSGRIIVPGYMWIKKNKAEILPKHFHNCISRSNIMYSDDGGDSWSLGGLAPLFEYRGKLVNSNEVQAVELSNGAICLNSRTVNSQQTRYWSCSYDGGQTFKRGHLIPGVPEPGYRITGGIMTSHYFPGCQGSTVGFPIGVNDTHQSILFSNPGSVVDRRFLSIRINLDMGLTWSEPFILDQHYAGYTDMSYFRVDIEGQSFPAFGILYEHGVNQECETIDFRIFTLGSLIHNINND